MSTGRLAANLLLEFPMNQKIIAMGRIKKIALVAHDHKKQDLVDWAQFNRGTLSRHQLFGTGTTSRLLEKEL